MKRKSPIPYGLQLVFSAVTALAVGATLIAQQKPAADANALEVIEIRPNFYVIAGDGSNIAVQLGTDCIVVVDTGTGEKAKQVIAEIRKLSTRPIATSSTQAPMPTTSAETTNSLLPASR